jgi:hypothetical protein
LNQGKQLLDDLKNSVEKGRSLDIQDEDGATAVRKAIVAPDLFPISVPPQYSVAG